MVTVAVHKDVLNYEPHVAFGMSRRKLTYMGIAIAMGLVVGWLCIGVAGMGTDVAIYPIMICAIPFFFLGFMKPYNMQTTDFVSFWLMATWLEQQLPYVSTPNLRGQVDPDAYTQQIRYERDPKHAHKKEVQRHYAKLRTQRGVECWYPVGEDVPTGRR